MTPAVVTAKGQIVIPAKLRREPNIKKGTKIQIEERNGEIVLRALTPEHFDRMAGVLASKGKLTRALLAERGREKEDRQ